MWSLPKYFVLATGCLLLTACGFSPMMASDSAQGSSGVHIANIRVLTSEGRPGQILRATLQDRLNPGVTPSSGAEYELSISLSASATPLATATDGTVQRYGVSAQSSYTLTRLSDRRLVDRGSVNKSASYNNQANTYYSTYVSQQDVLKRAVIELAEIYRNRMAAFFEAYPDGNAPLPEGETAKPADLPPTIRTPYEDPNQNRPEFPRWAD